MSPDLPLYGARVRVHCTKIETVQAGMSNSDSAKKYTTDIAFSETVKLMQTQLGSRGSMERLERSDTWPTRLTDDMKRFIAARDSLFLGSASAAAQPYIQHRGGEPGFVTVRDDRTLIIPDYRGNRHYISLGNFSENNRAFIFMIDYETRTRIKMWGRVSVESLESADDRKLVFHIETWDINCRQYLPKLWSEKTVQKATHKLVKRIEQLEKEIAELKREQ